MLKENAKGLARLVVAVIIVGSFIGILIINARRADFVLAQANERLEKNQRPNPENNYLFSEATPSGVITISEITPRS